MTLPSIQNEFKIGTRVVTMVAGWTLRGQVARYGTVVGFCDTRDDAVLVRWDGLKPKSAVMISTIDIEIVQE